ncbi:hypothetical protein [Spiroplasma diminutum]|uniref:Transmembrane protein n=1 Tax=Spiroplasma diminutum CUAS-1 TaxID=1276221 RepID=S5M0G9_9MOLU|nr:hypothetical protein [Spiroplasma diminutum]AGR42346.1 hypothetical protein SDIMI_v3c06420 [Spiroplasma diminutum CUAS-1]
MRKSIFFGVLILLAGSILSFLGVFLFEGKKFFFNNFDKEYGILNILQIIGLSFILSLFLIGSIRLFSKSGNAISFLYAILAIGSVAINFTFLTMLITKNPTIIKDGEIIIITSLLLNIIFLSIGSVALLISIVPMFKANSNVRQKVRTTKTSVSNNDSSEPFKPMVLRDHEQQLKEAEFNPEFTSTPNDETFNMSDKLAKLKEDISNNNFSSGIEQEIQEDEDNNANEPEVLEDEILEDEINEEELDSINNSENINYDLEKPLIDNFSGQLNEEKVQTNSLPKIEELPPITEPKDPYKQTIVPRRASQREGEFNKPIGNVVKPVYVEKIERRTARLDENYQGKVFLGDSDRIWEAMKKQERRLVPKTPKTDHLVSKSNIVNSLQSEKTKTMEIDIDRIMDPVNEENREEFTPTIDWDD